MIIRDPRKTCEKKVKYDSQSDALKAAACLLGQHGVRQCAYHCDSCHFWHLTTVGKKWDMITKF